MTPSCSAALGTQSSLTSGISLDGKELFPWRFWNVALWLLATSYGKVSQ